MAVGGDAWSGDARPAASAVPVDATPTFEELWGERRPGMLRLAYLLTGSRAVAEDVVQDAFVQLHRKWRAVRTPSAYLRTSVVNGSRSALRRRRTARGYTPPHEPHRPDPSDHAVLNEEHREVIVALNKLAQKRQSVNPQTAAG